MDRSLETYREIMKGFPMIQRNSSGAYVSLLQCMITSFSRTFAATLGNIDGSFGKNTEAAVIAYQQYVGLNPDGVVGTKTWSLLANGTYVYISKESYVTFTLNNGPAFCITNMTDELYVNTNSSWYWINPNATGEYGIIFTGKNP